MSNQENSQSGLWNVPVFRPELAFPVLSEEMVDRVRSYGREEILPANYALFRHGERQVDMFIVLDGEVSIALRARMARKKSSLSIAGSASAAT